jgi:DNA-binding MarR family transcriptional regulator
VSVSDDTVNLLETWAVVVMRRSMHAMSRFSRSNNLSMAQLNVLLWLYHHNECEVSAICNHSQVTKAAASQMVERLVQDGLVERRESPADRRVKHVSLTDHGRRLVQQSLEIRMGWMREMIGTLDPYQCEQIVQAMSPLTAMIDKDPDKKS